MKICSKKSKRILKNCSKKEKKKEALCQNTHKGVLKLASCLLVDCMQFAEEIQARFWSTL